jgi:hypothetical protein
MRLSVVGPISSSRAPLLALLGALSLAAAACPGGDGGGPGGDDDAGPGGGTGGVVDVGCSADEECGSGEICDLATGDCKPGLDCTANAGACRFCGETGVDCGFGVEPAYCSAEAGVCRRAKDACGACADDGECADGPTGLPSSCIDGFCAPGCGGAGGCPAGFTCETGGNGGGCVPVGGAAVCDGALACADGAGCPDGQQCTSLGVCLELCNADDECPLGTICQLEPGPQQQQCVQGCPLGDTVEQDGVLKVCHADGRYGLPCPTEGSTDGCPTGTECDVDGVCQRAGCQSDAECPLVRTFCDIAQGACVDGCNSDDDCGAFELCTDGACRAQGCRGKELSCDLGQWCCGKEAFADPSTCPSGVLDGQCFLAPDPWCRTCADNDDCADIDVLGKPSFCYELTRDNNGQQESLGHFCSVGCNSNADCPRGLDCVQGLPTDQDGVTTSGCLDTLCPAIAGAR